MRAAVLQDVERGGYRSAGHRSAGHRSAGMDSQTHYSNVDVDTVIRHLKLHSLNTCI